MSLSFHDMNKHFGKRRILASVSLSLIPGECQLLCGENGAGKSTLLRIFAGMERPDSGQVVVDGRVGAWRRARGRLLADCIYLHQRPYLFEGSVRYNLRYPLIGNRASRDARVMKGLEWSGLAGIADQAVHLLSGGERQRVALARAWLRQPRIMLLDEPTANMDLNCRLRTVELLQALKQEGMALIVATHDPWHFAEVADRAHHLVNGRLSEDKTLMVDLPAKVTPIDGRIRPGAQQGGGCG